MEGILVTHGKSSLKIGKASCFSDFNTQVFQALG
jgi:hypothetical protein